MIVTKRQDRHGKGEKTDGHTKRKNKKIKQQQWQKVDVVEKRERKKERERKRERERIRPDYRKERFGRTLKSKVKKWVHWPFCYYFSK